MRTVIRIVLPLIAVSVLEIGCGSDGVTSPSGATGAGATIQGTVNGGAVASGADVSASAVSAASLRVTIVGTSLSTTTDASGRFTLTGVPSGSVTLRFQGTGVDATLRIDGLADGQELTITVNVSGSRADLSGDNGHHTLELEGLIDSVTAPRLRVSGRTVVTDAHTSFKRVTSLAQLRAGDRVHVKGELQADGSILADEVMLQNPKD